MATLAASQPTFPSGQSSQPSSPTPHNEPLTVVALNRESKQPTAAELAKHGIKIRDFAFESTLPPIPPVYLLPKQIQPNPGVLRFCQDSSTSQLPSQECDGRKLERHSLQSLNLPFGVARQRGFVDLRDYDADIDELPDSQDSIYTLSQSPLPYPQSQESEEYVKTPIVTPNGSLQWPDDIGGDLPASQLDNVMPLRPLCLSQTPSRIEGAHKDPTPSPLSSANSSFCISPSPSKTLLPKHRSRRRPSQTIRTLHSHLNKDQTPPRPTSPVSRYYLRKRPNSGPPPSTTRPTTRSRLRLSTVSPSTPPSRRQEKASEGQSLGNLRRRSK